MAVDTMLSFLFWWFINVSFGSFMPKSDEQLNEDGLFLGSWKGGATQRCCDEKEVDPTSNPKTFRRKRDRWKSSMLPFLFWFVFPAVFFALAVNREISTVCYFFFCCWYLYQLPLSLSLLCIVKWQCSLQPGVVRAQRAMLHSQDTLEDEEEEADGEGEANEEHMSWMTKKKRRFKRSTQSKQKRRESRRKMPVKSEPETAERSHKNNEPYANEEISVLLFALTGQATSQNNCRIWQPRTRQEERARIEHARKNSRKKRMTWNHAELRRWRYDQAKRKESKSLFLWAKTTQQNHNGLPAKMGSELRLSVFIRCGCEVVNLISQLAQSYPGPTTGAIVSRTNNKRFKLFFPLIRFQLIGFCGNEGCFNPLEHLRSCCCFWTGLFLVCSAFSCFVFCFFLLCCFSWFVLSFSAQNMFFFPFVLCFSFVFFSFFRQFGECSTRVLFSIPRSLSLSVDFVHVFV